MSYCILSRAQTLMMVNSVLCFHNTEGLRGQMITKQTVENKAEICFSLTPKHLILLYTSHNAHSNVLVTFFENPELQASIKRYILWKYHFLEDLCLGPEVEMCGFYETNMAVLSGWTVLMFDPWDTLTEPCHRHVFETPGSHLNLWKRGRICLFKTLMVIK